MDNKALEDLWMFKKKQMLRLREVSDLTSQLSQAMDRRDGVSAQMLLSMRQEPVLQLQALENQIQRYLETLPEQDAIRCAQLLKGAEAVTEEEAPLAEQAALFQRVLAQIVEQDKRINLRVAGKKSFYRLVGQN